MVPWVQLGMYRDRSPASSDPSFAIVTFAVTGTPGYSIVDEVIRALHEGFEFPVLPAPYEAQTVPEFTWLLKVSVPVAMVDPEFDVVDASTA